MTDIQCSLDTLMRMMHAHYGKEVILLIDEYDVPLAKASDNGYYKEMLNVIKKCPVIDDRPGCKTGKLLAGYKP